MYYVLRATSLSPARKTPRAPSADPLATRYKLDETDRGGPDQGFEPPPTACAITAPSLVVIPGRPRKAGAPGLWGLICLLFAPFGRHWDWAGFLFYVVVPLSGGPSPGSPDGCGYEQCAASTEYECGTLLDKHKPASIEELLWEHMYRVST
jgi:hypothetical protein